MKMKSFRMIVPALALLVASCGAQEEKQQKAEVSKGLSGTYVVDAENSKVMWEGTMLEVGGVALYGHNGNIQIAKGEVTANDGKVSGGSVVIDMTTITPTDDNYRDADGGRASDLVGHLSSDDFFNVEAYPTSSFAIESAEDGTIVGKLTVRDVTKEVVINEININEVEDGTMTATGNFTFNRQDYNVRFAMPVQEKVLSDNIKLSFDIKASKQAA